MKKILGNKDFLYKLNLSLAIVCLLLFFCLLKEIATPLNEIDMAKIDIEKQKLKKREFFDFLKIPPFSTYEAVFEGRNLFSFLEESPKIEEKLEINLSPKFTLIGVIFSKGKFQALIRDTATNRDYCCSEGDVIEGIKVKKIYQDRVILESEGKLWELKL